MTDERPINPKTGKYLTTVMRADQVTEELIKDAEEIVEGWYNEGPIDWDNVWDRMEGSILEDGTELDMGTDIDSPAMRKIKREVRKRRRE